MRKNIKSTLFATLIALVMTAPAVLLTGCGGGGASSNAADDIVTIQTGRQLVNDTVEMTNYQVVFKQTPEEWDALSEADKERLALAGYDQACAQIVADEVSNFHILGMTSPGEDAEGNPTDSQQAFFLNLEEGTLLIKTGTETTATVAIELPLG
jgi:nucleoside phosphorylase